MKQRELSTLLGVEIARRLPDLESDDVQRARNALHALRGSSAMAGHGDLSLVIARHSARLRAGDLRAATDIAVILRAALPRLGAGESPFETSWPVPPPGLGPSDLDPRYRAEFVAAARDRLAELHAVLESPLAPADTLARATLAVHSIKGAAGSIGDDATAWYCHGLEARLRAAQKDTRLVAATLDELPQHAAVLSLLIEDQPAALEALGARGPSPSRPPASAPGQRPSSAPGHGAPSRRASAPPTLDDDTGAHTVRVQGVSLDRVLERLERIQIVEDDLGALASTSLAQSHKLSELRAELLDALRMLGPPRPWGPPLAALRRLEGAARILEAASAELADGSHLGHAGAERLRGATGDIRREVARVRRTTLSSVIGRVASSIERLAAREGRNVRVRVMATDAMIDREVAERLVDPLMQLARNALAHGIEPPNERIQRGKEPIGTLLLTGERSGDWLRIACEDDGRGVDMDSIRRAAARHGLTSAEVARIASDDELLGLLFAPGLTTKSDADLLAGRGVGLDLALSLVRRMGGTIRLARRASGGFSATIQVPSERWMTDVLWLEAGPWTLALPVVFTGRVERAPRDKPLIHLSRCLGERPAAPAALSLELSLDGIPSVAIGVDAVGEVEECSLKPLPSAVAAAGPFSGAIVRGDGALHLCLDAMLLAVRAWSLA